MSITRPLPSITTILKPASDSGSDDEGNISPPESDTLLSPSLSTLHLKASTMTVPYRQHSRSSSSSTSSRHFSSSTLGRPPGSQQQTKRKTTPTPTPSSSFPMSCSPSKTIPMKELQKIIADLKKENFNLKLRLYHLEQPTEKDMEIHRLVEDNERLQLELDDQATQVEHLKQTLSTLLEQQVEKRTCDASIQTTTTPPPPFVLPPTPPTRSTTTIDTTTTTTSYSEPRSHVAQHFHSSPFSAPVLPTFPADPASFGLPPSSALSASAAVTSTTKKLSRSSFDYNNNNSVDVAAMVDRFQHVQLASPKVNRRASAGPTTTTSSSSLNDHGRVTGWLDRLPIPSFMASSSTPVSPQSQ